MVEMRVMRDLGRREAQTSAWTWGWFHAALAASAVATAVTVALLDVYAREAEWPRNREVEAELAVLGVVLGLALGAGGLTVRASRGLAHECSIRRGVIPDLLAARWLLAMPIAALAAGAVRALAGWNGFGLGLLALYLAWCWAISVAAFILYGADKHVAVERGWGRSGVGHRIPEKTLQGLALLGGLPGSLVAQRVFHHKTSIEKRGFRAGVWLLAIIHYAAAVVLAVVWLRREG